MRYDNKKKPKGNWSGHNTSYVCFDCRSVARNGGGDCRFCNKPLTMLGIYIKVPKKSDDKGWKQLEKRMVLRPGREYEITHGNNIYSPADIRYFTRYGML